MKENKTLYNMQEQVVLTPDRKRIEINHAIPERAYGLFDSDTGTQLGNFIKGTDGQVEFIALNPLRHYDVGAIENYNDDNVADEGEKPEFAISWNSEMKDDTDSILKNSDNLPVVYPQPYLIKDNKDQNGTYDLLDSDNNPVGQVRNLTPSCDKPRFVIAWTFKMKDDENK